MTPLGGVWVAAATPHLPDGRHIDPEATAGLLDYLSAKGVAGVALLGSTGVFVQFEIQERIRLVALAARHSRLPIAVNVSHPTPDGALLLAREAASAGARAVLLMPPYYFRYTQPQVREFYLRFVDELRGAAPVLLYNIPFFTTEIAVETAEELLASGGFAGIKDSSGRFDYFCRLHSLRSRQPFTLFIGNDVLFTRGRSAGADGVISGVACAAPELMLGLERAILTGDAPRVAALEARLVEFIGWLDRFPGPVGVIEATAARGVPTGAPVMPLDADTRRLRDEFCEWFRGWLPLVQKESQRD